MLIDLLEWQIKFKPYFMHTLYDAYGKIYELSDWLKNLRFKKSHIRQMEDQFKFMEFSYGIKIWIYNGAFDRMRSMDIYEEFVKSIFPMIKKDNYFAKIIMQPLFILITECQITINNQNGAKLYSTETCINPYYPILITQIYEWREYIDRLHDLTRQERFIMKGYIKHYHSKVKQIYEFNQKYCLKK